MKLRYVGEPSDVVFDGANSHQGREPYPVIDVTGCKVIIGEEAVISAGVYIHTHTHSFNKKKWIYMLQKPKVDKPTVIGKYTFIGVNAQIMHTCKRIGDYSVIAAGSIVTKDVPDCEIWAGNPAVKIGEVED